MTPWGLLQTPLPLDAGPHLSRLPFTTQAQPPSPDPRASQVTWRNGPQPRRSPGSLPPPQSLVSPPELGPVVFPWSPWGEAGWAVVWTRRQTPPHPGPGLHPGQGGCSRARVARCQLESERSGCGQGTGKQGPRGMGDRPPSCGMTEAPTPSAP